MTTSVHNQPAPLVRSWLAWACFCLTVTLLVVALLLGLSADNFVLFPVTLSLGLVGAFVSARTGNRVGWLFVADGVAVGLCLLAEAYASASRNAPRASASWSGWAFTILLEAGTFGIFLIPLLFPDGQPPSPRWRPVVWLQIAAGVGGASLVSVSDVNFSANFPHLRDPVTVLPASDLVGIYAAKQYVQVLLFVVSAAAIVVRLMRSSGEERLQLKWFTYAAALGALAFAVAALLIPQPVIAFAVFFPLIPVAAGVAIIKYRLYDIDRIISRTLAYAIVTGVLVALYAGLVLLATQVLTLTSQVGVAAATLAAAALFNPLRRRVQRRADRRFNRARYNADNTVAAFAARLHDATDPDEVRSGLIATVQHALEPAHMSVWITRPEGIIRSNVVGRTEG